MPCFDRCQLTITRMFNIQDVRGKLAGVWPQYGQVILVRLAYMEGCTAGRTVTKNKFSRTDGLPYFLTNGALRAHLW